MEPIDKRNTVVDLVIEKLLNYFLQGSLKMWNRLPPEMELAKRLGVSRNSMREAMKVLEVLGIVERRQGDGSYIASDGDHSLAPMLFALFGSIGTSTELVELRQMLEVGLVDLIIDKVDEDGIEKISQKLDEMKKLATESEMPVEKFIQNDIDFHYAIIECSKNTSVIKLGKLLMRLFGSSMAEHLTSSHGVKRAIEDHEAIFEAIKARDRVKAREMVVKSFDVWKQYIRVPK